MAASVSPAEAGGFLAAPEHDDGGLAAHAVLLLQFALVVVVGDEQRAGDRGVALPAVEDLFLRAAGGAPVGVEVQRDGLAGLLQFGKGLRRVGLYVEGEGKAGVQCEEQGDDRLHGVSFCDE